MKRNLKMVIEDSKIKQTFKEMRKIEEKNPKMMTIISSHTVMIVFSCCIFSEYIYCNSRLNVG